MNKSLMVTIAVTASVTLVAQAILRWAFPILDVFVPVSKAPDKVRTFWSDRGNRSLFWNGAVFLANSANVVGFALDKSPITRLTVLYGCFIFGVALGSLLLLIGEIIRHRYNRAKALGAG
jgi:hypothetical protein